MTMSKVKNSRLLRCSLALRLAGQLVREDCHGMMMISHYHNNCVVPNVVTMKKTIPVRTRNRPGCCNLHNKGSSFGSLSLLLSNGYYDDDGGGTHNPRRRGPRPKHQKDFSLGDDEKSSAEYDRRERRRRSLQGRKRRSRRTTTSGRYRPRSGGRRNGNNDNNEYRRSRDRNKSRRRGPPRPMPPPGSLNRECYRDALVSTVPSSSSSVEVWLVQKQDQRTGKETRGTIKQILTKSQYHPRGIKVMLESGIVGRVTRIVPDENKNKEDDVGSEKIE